MRSYVLRTVLLALAVAVVLVGGLAAYLRLPAGESHQIRLDRVASAKTRARSRRP